MVQSELGCLGAEVFRYGAAEMGDPATVVAQYDVFDVGHAKPPVQSEHEDTRGYRIRTPFAEGQENDA